MIMYQSLTHESLFCLYSSLHVPFNILKSTLVPSFWLLTDLGNCDFIGKVLKVKRENETHPIIIFSGGLPATDYLDKNTVTISQHRWESDLTTLECPSKVYLCYFTELLIDLCCLIYYYENAGSHFFDLSAPWVKNLLNLTPDELQLTLCFLYKTRYTL